MSPLKYLKINPLSNQIMLLFGNYKIQVFLVSLYVFFIFLNYILGTTPNCCEDIYFINPLGPEQKINWVWAKTIAEGRFISSFIMAFLSGFFNTHITSLLVVGFSIYTSILITLSWNCKKRYFSLILALLSLNSSLLMLYTFQFYSSIFSIANFAIILLLYYYRKNKYIIFFVPLITVIVLGIYQITFTFGLMVLFLMFFIDVFEEKKFLWKSKLFFYSKYFCATILGFFAYHIILHVLLSFHGKTRITRIELWGGRDLKTFQDYFFYGIECFNSFLGNGIRSSLNPGDSFWLGDIHSRFFLIKLNEILIPVLLVILLFYSIQKKDFLKIILVIIFLPITIGIVLAPTILSGSNLIARTFFPFGLVLPALILAILNLNFRFFKLKSLVTCISIILLLANSFFHVEVFQEMREKSQLAKVEHEKMYEVLSANPNFSPERKVLIYWYNVNHPNDKTYIGSNFWPMYHSTSMDILFKYEINKNISFVSLDDTLTTEQQEQVRRFISFETLTSQQREQVRRFIVDQKLPTWNEKQSTIFMPPNSSFSEGLLILYYPYELLISSSSLKSEDLI
jgi:hypothetical protein